MEDPLAEFPRPFRRLDGSIERSGPWEFRDVEIKHIRTRKFDMTQEEFARMIGISVDTLRNWETGRRCPQGPARALLRIIDAEPRVVAEVLSFHALRGCLESDD